MSSLLNSKTLTLALAGGTALLAVYSRTSTPSSFDQSKTKVFTDLLGALSVLVFGLTLIDQQDQNERTYALQSVDYTDQNIQDQWLGPNKLFADKAALVPELIASLNKHNTVLQAACARSPQACAKAAQEYDVCIDLAQRVELFLTFRQFDNTGDNTWISCFLPWHRSELLQKYFPMLAYAYRERTAALMKLMFEYATSKPMNTSEDIDHTANLLIADPRYAQILMMTT